MIAPRSPASASPTQRQFFLPIVVGRMAFSTGLLSITDQETVLTGSFNFPKAAEEHNAKNLKVIRNREIAKKYLENWQKHQKHSDPYAGSKSQQPIGRRQNSRSTFLGSLLSYAKIGNLLFPNSQTKSNFSKAVFK